MSDYLYLKGKKVLVESIWAETYLIGNTEQRRFYARYKNQTISATTEKGLIELLHKKIK